MTTATFDSKCYDLAEAFLSDEPNLFTDSACMVLAAHIQQAIEDWIADARDSAAEDAWQRQQEALMESGGPDDSAYRRDMINAGRGHLLR